MKRVSILFNLIAIIILLYYPDISYSAVNLPWSTTYNCADWTWSNGVNPVCDGLIRGGDWTCDNGNGTVSREQITVLANRTGSSGKGQRHWLGDGLNNDSAGLSVSFASPQNEIWMQWYMRYQQGFDWGILDNQKIIYFDPTGPATLVVGYDQGDRTRVWSYPAQRGYYSAYGWNDVMGSTVSDGNWHRWDIHIKMDTSGSNGIVEVSIDGNQIIRETNADLGTTTLNSVLIGSNGYNPANGQCMYVDYDDISISGIATASGGNSSGGGSSDTSISGGGCGIIKDISNKPNSAAGQIAINILLLLLPLIFIKIWQLKKIREGVL